MLPAIDKRIVYEIKNKIEKKCNENKVIIYDPLPPRKNISITLGSTYESHGLLLRQFEDELKNSWVCD